MRADAVRVRVQLFAWLRDAAGTEETTVELAAGARGDDARDALAARWPALRALLPGVRLAVNQEYRPWGTALADGDALALIPPVSGG